MEFEKNRLTLCGNRAAENIEISDGWWETHRIDVNICMKLKFSVNSWYFAGK